MMKKIIGIVIMFLVILTLSVTALTLQQVNELAKTNPRAEEVIEEKGIRADILITDMINNLDCKKNGGCEYNPITKKVCDNKDCVNELTGAKEVKAVEISK